MLVANTLPLFCGPSDSNWLMIAGTGEDYIKVTVVIRIVRRSFLSV
jgi:hypothetical protein